MLLPGQNPNKCSGLERENQIKWQDAGVSFYQDQEKSLNGKNFESPKNRTFFLSNFFPPDFYVKINQSI